MSLLEFLLFIGVFVSSCELSICVAIAFLILVPECDETPASWLVMSDGTYKRLDKEQGE